MRKEYLKIAFALTMTAVVSSSTACGGSGNQAAESLPSETAVETPAPESVGGEEKDAPVKEDSDSKSPVSQESAAEYLKVYFEVEAGQSVDKLSFSENLKKVAGGEAPEVEDELTWMAALKAAVKAADYEELALSYPEEKVRKRLTAHGVDGSSLEAEDQAILACALDVSLVTESDGKRAADGDEFTAEDENRLLMQVVDANGDGRNYLGMASDPEIYGKLDQMWNSFIIFDDEQLAQVGKTAVEQEITTGYGIKSFAYDARFLPELTLQYGHSDIKHAHQLIGLLNSEGIDAKVQLEPKISIYQYLLEWGPIPEPTLTYEVKQFDDLYLVYAVEYDLKLEFNNTEDMQRFDGVINEFAKKNEGNEDAVGLIYGSWWQPLYSTTKTDMPEEAYHQIFDCVVTNGMYSIHPFTLPEDKDDVVKKFEELSGGLPVEAVERYCNTAFYHYLKGEDYQ